MIKLNKNTFYNRPRNFKFCNILTYSYDIPVFDIDNNYHIGYMNLKVKYESRNKIDEQTTLNEINLPKVGIILYTENFLRDNAPFLFISSIKFSKKDYQRYLRMKKLERVLNND